MSANVGNIDRVLRALIGIILIAAPFAFASDLWANPLYEYGAIVVGLVMLTVAITRVCQFIQSSAFAPAKRASFQLQRNQSL